MKHLFRLMGQLCPLSNNYKTKLTAMVAVMALFMCLIAAIQAPAQTGAAANMDEIKPLQIGDQIPEELWHLPLQVVNHPEGKETITLNDYRGKLIILDFWATWCGSCIKKFPDIAQYNSLFADSAVILLVNAKSTRDTFEKVQQTLRKHGDTLTSVIDDEQLKELFPIKVLPYQVWIDSERKLTGLTFSEFLNDKSIRLNLNRQFLIDSLKKKWKNL